MVAPHAGAWIETLHLLWVLLDIESRPTRARGLKLYVGRQDPILQQSRPRGRVD